MVECMPSPDIMGFVLYALSFGSAFVLLILWLRQRDALYEAKRKEMVLRSDLETTGNTLRFARIKIDNQTKQMRILQAMADEYTALVRALDRLGLEIEWSPSEGVEVALEPVRLLSRRSAIHIGPRVNSVPAPSVGIGVGTKIGDLRTAGDGTCCRPYGQD